MNRRKLLATLASLPFAGVLFKPNDGVALTCGAHPIGEPCEVELNDAALTTVEMDFPIYAHAGETVTCENGHPICDFARDVYRGMMQDPPRDFTNWRQVVPVVGERLIPMCAVCGASFTNGLVYHVGDAWRDPYNIRTGGGGLRLSKEALASCPRR